MPKKDQGTLSGRYQVIPRTLIFITHGDKVLLLKGSPHKRLWSNKYNGIGGHIERGEDVLTSARRELKEEAGIEVDHLFICGVIIIDASDNAGISIFVLKGKYQGGDLIPSEEGQLEWIDPSCPEELPLLEDLKTLLPRVLETGDGAFPFSAHYRYDDADQLVITFGT